MITGKHGAFMSNSIKKLRTAIFYDLSTSILKFRTCIITALAIDNSGNCWFLVKKPYESIRDFEQEFPVQLHFYNKNCDYYVTAQGIATILLNEYELPANQPAFKAATVTGNEILIRVHITIATWYGSRKSIKPGFVTGINHLITRLINNAGNDHSSTVQFNL